MFKWCIATIQGNEGAEICVEIGAEPAHVGRPSPGMKRMILISVFVHPLHSPGVRLDLGGNVRSPEMRLTRASTRRREFGLTTMLLERQPPPLPHSQRAPWFLIASTAFHSAFAQSTVS